MRFDRVIQVQAFKTPWRWVALATMLLGLWPATAHAQTSIVIDYSFDTNNFFPDGSQQRTTLNNAASFLSNQLGDTLAAIQPSGQNTWTAIINNPATGAQQNISNPTIPQNEIRVYAGGRSLGGPLGIGGPGGFSASAPSTQLNAWVDAIRGRGESGAIGPQSSRTDFAPWGGAITFDTLTNWNFSLVTGPGAGQSDFLSVALHELGHVLGYGTADSWDNQIASGGPTGLRFTGPVSTALNGGVNPPLYGPDGGAHWNEGITYQGEAVAMDPFLTVGTRVSFTELDFGGLDDIGWEITPVPEPATVLGVGALGLGVLGLRRRRAARV